MVTSESSILRVETRQVEAVLVVGSDGPTDVERRRCKAVKFPVWELGLKLKR